GDHAVDGAEKPEKRSERLDDGEGAELSVETVRLLERGRFEDDLRGVRARGKTRDARAKDIAEDRSRALEKGDRLVVPFFGAFARGQRLEERVEKLGRHGAEAAKRDRALDREHQDDDRAEPDRPHEKAALDEQAVDRLAAFGRRDLLRRRALRLREGGRARDEGERRREGQHEDHGRAADLAARWRWERI